MKVLSKVLWAIDFDIDHTISIEKIRTTAKQFGNEIILLHVLPEDINKSTFQEVVERSTWSELDKVKKKLAGSADYKIETRIVYGNVVDRILDVSEEEDVNIVFINRGKNVSLDETSLGLNAQRVFRNSHKPVAIISETPPFDKPHIVVPVDSSEPSALALKSAIIHAKKINAKLSVISVYEPTSITSVKMISMGLDEKSENERHFRIFKEEFKEFIKDFDFGGLDYETVLLTGIPHEEIVSFAKRATILYMGSTGKSGLRRVVLGSVTEKVISRMSCNIVAMKSEELFKLKIPTDLLDIENHYNRAYQLSELGYLEEAIAQYKMCLRVNDMHIPSMYALSKLYDKLGDKAQSGYYNEMSKIVMSKMTDIKIEEEIRRTIHL